MAYPFAVCNDLKVRYNQRSKDLHNQYLYTCHLALVKILVLQSKQQFKQTITYKFSPQRIAKLFSDSGIYSERLNSCIHANNVNII